MGNQRWRGKQRDQRLCESSHPFRGVLQIKEIVRCGTLEFSLFQLFAILVCGHHLLVILFLIGLLLVPFLLATWDPAHAPKLVDQMAPKICVPCSTRHVCSMDKKMCPACSLCRSCLGALLAPNPPKQTVSSWESFWHGKIPPSALTHAVASADKETHQMRSNSGLQNSAFHVQCVLFPQQTRNSVVHGLADLVWDMCFKPRSQLRSPTQARRALAWARRTKQASESATDPRSAGANKPRCLVEVILAHGKIFPFCILDSTHTAASRQRRLCDKHAHVTGVSFGWRGGHHAEDTVGN
jgi:hypothetical protein